MAAPFCAKRAVELAVRTPFTIAARVLQVTLPLAGQLLSRGWAQAGQVERDFGGRVDQARVVGKFAVTAGGRQLRKEMETRFGGGRQPVEERFRPQVTPAPNGASEGSPVADPQAASASSPSSPRKGPPTRRATGTTTGSSASTASTGSLAIPDYDELSASQVTRRLQGLAASELAEVRAYEASNRNRKTVLAAIDRLLA